MCSVIPSRHLSDVCLSCGGELLSGAGGDYCGRCALRATRSSLTVRATAPTRAPRTLAGERPLAVSLSEQPYSPTKLSASAIGEYLACPARYYLTRVAGETVPPTKEMLFGRALHVGLAGFHHGEAEPADLFLAAWKVDADAYAVDPAYIKTMRLLGLELLERYTAEVFGPSAEPEVRWEVTFPNLRPRCVGIYDLVDRPAAVIGEHKSAAWPWSPERVVQNLQGAFYAAAFHQTEGTLPTLVYTVLSCNPTPAVTTHVRVMTVEDCDRAIETARVVMGCMERAEWRPGCAKDVCSFPERCGRTP